MDREHLEFNKNALQGVLTAPLCAEYKADWRKCGDDTKSLLDLILRQQSLPFFTTHCYKGVGLSKEYTKKRFGKYLNGKYRALNVDGVEGDYYSTLYITDKNVNNLADDVCCFMWSNVDDLNIKPTKATKLYITCGSNVRLNCGGYNCVTIMLFDDSKIVLDDIDEASMITIYNYSAQSSIEYGKFCFSEKIKVFNKELRL